MAIEITAFDIRKGTPTRLSRPVVSIQVPMHDVASMVTNSLNAAGALPMNRLNVMVGGAPSSNFLTVGDDVIARTTIHTFEPILRQLRGRFSVGGVLHFAGPYAGRNHELLKMLAEITGVTVLGGDGVNSGGQMHGQGYVMEKPTKQPVFREKGVPFTLRRIKGLTAA
jgi:hypothetical protein